MDLDYFVSLIFIQFPPKLKEIISQITIAKFLHIQTDLNGYNVLKLGFERGFLRLETSNLEFNLVQPTTLIVNLKYPHFFLCFSVILSFWD